MSDTDHREVFDRQDEEQRVGVHKANLEGGEISVYGTEELEEEHYGSWWSGVQRDDEAHAKLLELSLDFSTDLDEAAHAGQASVVPCATQYTDNYAILKKLWDDFHSEDSSFTLPAPIVALVNGGSGNPNFGSEQATHLSYFHRFPVDERAQLKLDDSAPPSEYSDLWLPVATEDSNAAAIHEVNWIMLNLSYQITEVVIPRAVELGADNIEQVKAGNHLALQSVVSPRSQDTQLYGIGRAFDGASGDKVASERPGGNSPMAGTALVYNQLHWAEDYNMHARAFNNPSRAGDADGLTLKKYERSSDDFSDPSETYPRSAQALEAWAGEAGVNVSIKSTYGLNSLGGHGAPANAKYNLPKLPSLLEAAAGGLEDRDPRASESLALLAERITRPIQAMEEAAACINAAAKEIDEVYSDWREDLKDMLEKEEDNDIVFDDEQLLGALNYMLKKGTKILPPLSSVSELVKQAKDPSRIFFREQCYLLSYIRQFALARKDREADISRNNRGIMKMEAAGYSGRGFGPAPGEHQTALSYDDWGTFQPPSKALPYYTGNKNSYEGNACCVIDGDPYALLNKLVTDKRQQAYMNISNDKLSYLQPKIRLFKVAYDGDGLEENIEVKFDTHFSQTDMSAYMTYGQRGAGVGVKSFDFTYDGSNPFSAKKSIKAKLKIFANTFDDLMLCRGLGKCDDPNDEAFFKSYRYIDLALKTSSPRPKTATNEESCEAAIARTERLRENIELQKLNFRLKAHVGIEVPQNQELSKNLTTGELSELAIALNCSCVTLNLTPTVHTFDLDEQGRVIFEINYLAYVEDFYDHAAFNIFADREISLKRIVRNSQMEAAQTACEYDELDELKEDAAIESAKEFRTLLTTLIGKLIAEEKMQYFSVDQGQLYRFIERGAYSDVDLNYSRGVWAGFKDQDDDSPGPGETSPILTAAEYGERLKGNLESTMDIFVKSKTDDEMENEDRKIALALNDNYKTTIPFFYIADLIDIALKNIEGEVTGLPELITGYMNDYPNDAYNCILDQHKYNAKRYQESFKKLRIVLGPVEFVGVKSASESAFVNLGDVPISAKYFIEWMTSKFLKKNEMVYSLSQFLNDVLNNLVNQFLNGTKCPVAGTSQKVRLNQATITGQAIPPTEAVQSLIKADVPLDVFTNHALTTGYMRFDAGKWASPQPILNPSGFSGASARTTIPADEEINYMVYFVGRTMPTEQMKGNKAEDEAKGVYHYLLGRDRGLVKSIKLQKTATPGLAEVRFEQEGYDGLEQLRVVYDVEIESYANVNTFPGTYIYIEPAGFSPSAKLQNIDLTKFGIGGYYMIIKSSHTFLAGQLKSTITAKWVNQLEGEEAAAIRDTRNEDASKCAMAKTRAELASESIEDFLFDEAEKE